MLAGMTGEHFMEWREFFGTEPFGFDIAADSNALLCAVVANSAPFRSGGAIPPSRFRLRPGKEKEQEEPEPDGVQNVLGAATSVGPDLSRPIPDDD